jgi:hypothetical protein
MMPTAITPKRRKLFFISFGMVAITLVCSWIIFLTTNAIALPAHYLGLILFLPVAYFTFRRSLYKQAIVSLGIYLLLGAINLFSFTPFVTTSSFRLFGVWTPAFNWVSVMVLGIYLVLNLDTLIDIRLDDKEAKGKL